MTAYWVHGISEHHTGKFEEENNGSNLNKATFGSIFIKEVCLIFRRLIFECIHRRKGSISLVRFQNPNTQHSFITFYFQNRVHRLKKKVWLFSFKKLPPPKKRCGCFLLRSKSIIETIIVFLIYITCLFYSWKSKCITLQKGGILSQDFSRQRSKRKITNWLSRVHWFTLYSEKPNPFIPVSDLPTLFTVPSAKWNVGTDFV